MYIANDEIRHELPKLVEQIFERKKPVVYEFGGSAKRPHYKLVPLSTFDFEGKEEMARAVRITAEEARKGWSDVRAAVRLLGLRFVITTDGIERAAIRPHPGSFRSNARLASWLAGSTGQPEQSVTLRLTRTLEERIARLERTVDQLGNEVVSAMDMAEEADSNAGDAASTAELAQSTAEEAQSSAEEAAVEAAGAAGTAEDALETADEARDEARSAGHKSKTKYYKL